MSNTVYRFLPWARRGLAAALPGDRAEDAPIPQRGTVAVEVVVAGAGRANPSATLYGPADVVGLDPTTIIRVFPRQGSSNAEPNYLVAVDFDPPDLPWAFTPAGPTTSGRLPPWLVLVVVEDRAGVEIAVPPGAPLPRLRIESGAAAELPDLTESWAWAHTQLLAPEGDVADALRDHPERNVSRLVAPRRLRPSARWHACLVPAFDAGVVRGLGGTPDVTRPLGPAWTDEDAITLPLYFHWSFGTGPAGDFESLARRIKPHRAGSDVGRVRMHIGAGSPAVRLPEGAPDRFLDMDGALRAPSQVDGSLAEVPGAISAGLRRVAEVVADAADGVLGDGGPADDPLQPVGPPVYASHHARHVRVDPTAPTWMRELNLDPRCRVAAGLGAEVVRENQEDFVHAAWKQVGAVLEANALLSRARLGLEAALRFHARHLKPQPPDRLLQLTAPLSGRTPFGATTVSAAIRPTSLPDAVIDPALRRVVAPTSHLVAHAVKRRAVEPRSQLVARYALGRETVDPTRFAQPPLVGLGTVGPPQVQEGRVDLSFLGLPITVDASEAETLFARSEALRRASPPDDRVGLRVDLSATGLLGEAHVRTARHLARAETMAPSLRVDVLDALTSVAHERAGTEVVVEARERPIHAPSSAIDLTELVFRPRPVEAPALRPDRGLTLAPRPPMVFLRRPGADAHATTPVERAGERPAVASGVGQPGVIAALSPSFTTLLAVARTAGKDRIVVPPLLTDNATLARYEAAWTDARAATFLANRAPVPELVSFDLHGAAAALLARSNPEITNPARVGTMVKLGGVAVTARDQTAARWKVAPLLDRVMAYPVFDVPLYKYLARYDRTRFVPGIDSIPTDSVTLLETNPRFVAAFLAGVNHEMGRELLWRGYPTDQRGTPFRKFWGRLDGRRDIDEMHRWRGGTLAAQTTDGRAKLTLLLRGELLRRYPNTLVVARRAQNARSPSMDDADLKLPIFRGTFEPDVSFFGFDLEDHQLTEGAGWFFALLEPVAEPRFGLDEEADPNRGTLNNWQEAAWSDVGTQPGGRLTSADLGRVSSALPTPRNAAAVAAALFQQPFELVVHARHLTDVP